MNTNIYNIFNRKISKIEKKEKIILEEQYDIQLQPYRFLLLDIEERLFMDSFLKSINHNNIKCDVKDIYKNINLNDMSEILIKDEHISLMDNDYMLAGRLGTFVDTNNKTYYSYIFDNDFFKSIKSYIN